MDIPTPKYINVGVQPYTLTSPYKSDTIAYINSYILTKGHTIFWMIWKISIWNKYNKKYCDFVS